jgi:hypothetical protein
MSTDQTPFEIICETADALESDRNRKVLAQLNSSITDAVRSAQRSNQKSTVTLKLSIKAHPDGRITAAATVDAKLPRPPVNAAQLFADGMGNLLTSDPRQGKLLEVKPNRRTNEGEN